MKKAKEYIGKRADDFRITKETKKILEDLDMQKDYKGFHLWIEAVRYVIAEKCKNNLCSMTDVYITLGQKYKLKDTQIERALRDARNTIEKDMQLYFRTKHKITNSLFLALIRDKVEELIKI